MTRAKPAPRAVNDGLANVMTGLGTSADKNAHRFYAFLPVDQFQAEAAYRTSWLARKIVDAPCGDMTRNWREHQAEKDQIELIEAAERRLMLKSKARRALILGRLYGGGALVMGVRQGDPSEPVVPASLGKDALAYVHVMSRHQLSYDTLDMDVNSPWYGQPVMWRVTGGNSRVNIHPSRVIAFCGQQAPEGSVLQVDRFWGDPIMQSVGDAVANADLSQAGFATLINEASQDIIGIPELMSSIGSSEYEARLIKRLTLAQMSKSTHRALIKDAAETWDQRQVNWAGMPDIINTYLNIVAGAADIPVTRLLGKSPGGLGSNGDGEERDYFAMIASQQDSELRPALDRIDEVMLPSIFGSRPADVYWTFGSLAHETPKQKIDAEKAAADTLKVYADAGLISTDVLAKVAENRMIESGEFPGVKSAIEDAKAMMGAEPARSPNEPDPSAMVTDAAPRSLYVCRKVVNVDDLAAWAASQGLPALQADLHVTIVYSLQPVDWMKIDGEWNADDKGEVTIPPGGVRIVEPLGDRTAVLLFTSSALTWRHESIIRAGASHGYPDYQPHISLTGEPIDVDLRSIEPYRGKIILGPEIFEEVKSRPVEVAAPDPDVVAKIVSQDTKINALTDMIGRLLRPRTKVPVRDEKGDIIAIKEIEE